MKKMIKDLKEKTEIVLRDYPDTRNDDALLTFYLIWKHLGSCVKYIDKNTGLPVAISSPTTETFISTFALKQIREDAVSRVRRKINEEGKYLPTDIKVVRKRKMNEIEWREYMARN